MAKQVRLDENGYRKFGVRDKLAYAAGDFGCNMSFALKSYLTIFWTQYMGMDSYVMSGLLLLVQVWDAINDPVIGAMIDADKRQYKRNKFLTYIWIGSIGLLVAGALCFIPWKSAPAMAKNILFVAGYILWDAFYTIANVPYGSMLSLISTNPGDRAELSSFRSVGAMAGGIATSILIPILIYDSSNNLKGDVIFWIALVMGVLGFLAFQFMIKNTVVRVNVPVTLSEEQPKFNPIKAMGNFLKNRPAVGATLAPIGTFIGMYGAATANTVLWQSYFQNAQISGLMGMLSQLPMFLFMPFIRKIVSRWGKKEAVTVGSTVTLIGYVLLLVLPIPPNGTGIAIFIACQLVAGLGTGIFNCVSYALMADAIDYNEWKFGVRDEGTTYAMHSFFRKLAQGVGPSVGLAVATMMGYNAALGAAQTAETALTMRYLVAWFYIIAGVVSFIGVVLVYNLDQKTVAKMQAELDERKAIKK